MLITANIFQPLIDVFEAVLKFFHNSLSVPWGLSIVLLTVVIRALLVPLTIKQFSSMQKMQTLSPQIKAIQARYKDDKQRQQQEMMRLYKETGVNPLGSCLPLAAQFPVFISLFYMLRQSLRNDICPNIQRHYESLHGAGHTTPCGAGHGAGFLFIPDLTNRAAGAVLIVLIVLYVGSQLVSSRMMSNPNMDQTQQRIFLLLPLFFVIFIINFPAGVILYWITTNIWTIGQQYVVKRRLAHAGAPADAPDATTPDAAIVRRSSTSDAGARESEAGTAGNGQKEGGVAGLLRGLAKPSTAANGGAEGKEAVGARRRGAPPPPPPRKKKKRSGRRR